MKCEFPLLKAVAAAKEWINFQPRRGSFDRQERKIWKTIANFPWIDFKVYQLVGGRGFFSSLNTTQDDDDGPPFFVRAQPPRDRYSDEGNLCKWLCITAGRVVDMRILFFGRKTTLWHNCQTSRSVCCCCSPRYLFFKWLSEEEYSHATPDRKIRKSGEQLLSPTALEWVKNSLRRTTKECTKIAKESMDNWSGRILKRSFCPKTE